MNKLRVFRNVKNMKRTASGLTGINPGTVLLIFLFLPYIITVLFGNGSKTKTDKNQMLSEQLKEGYYTVINETSMGKERISLEIYVADKLMRTMGEEYEEEALKAQAVLLRGNLITDEGMSITVSDDAYGKKDISEKYLMAVLQTKGIYMEYENKPVYGAYFRVSNGETRTAAEVLQSESYPYLVKTVCDKDFLSKEYTGTFTYKKSVFEKIWETMDMAVPSESIQEQAENENRYIEKNNRIMIRDSAGYVLFFKYQDKWVQGEQLRYALALSSSAFQIEEKEDEFVFTCKGTGHGLGMSQFGANEMALEGKDFIEILKYFFEGATFTKIE